jgi:hypothetical protein
MSEVEGGIRLEGNCDRYTPDAGTVKGPVYCGVCATPMEVQLNYVGPRGMVEAMASHNKPDYKFTPADVFTCPHREEDWHYQVHLLNQMIAETPSSAITTLLQEEVVDILFERKPTKKIFNPHKKPERNCIPGEPDDDE